MKAHINFGPFFSEHVYLPPIYSKSSREKKHMYTQTHFNKVNIIATTEMWRHGEGTRVPKYAQHTER